MPLMTKEEFIQQITIVGVETSIAYMVAVRSDNLTVESSIEDVFDALCLNQDYKKGFRQQESWGFVNMVHYSQDANLLRIMNFALVATLLCHGETLNHINSTVTHYLDKVWEDISEKYTGNRVSHSVMWDHRYQLFLEVRNRFPLKDR